MKQSIKKLINEFENYWNGFWKCRNGIIVLVDDYVNWGTTLSGVKIEYDKDGTALNGDNEWDLMERIREGGKEYETIVAEFNKGSN